MGESTGISWCDHTWNPWIGCQRVSPGCENCYAEQATPTRVQRAKGLELWGPPTTTQRKRTAPDNWRNPLRWNAAAAKAGVRRRMFVASLADVFENHPQAAEWRPYALAILAKCTSLDVQLLTKRPQNVRRMVPPEWLESWPAHVWIGTTVEDQKRADQRIPHLLDVPARVRFLSCEPLLESVDLAEWIAMQSYCKACGEECEGSPDLCPSCGRDSLITTWGEAQMERLISGERYDDASALGRADLAGDSGIGWVIVGGESGPGARPFDLAWARSIVAQCDAAGVPVFVKQLGARPVDSARAAIHQPCMHERRPAIRTTIHRADAPEVAQARVDAADTRLRLSAPQVEHPLYLRGHFRLDDRAGADPSQWPADLRRQSFPEVHRG